MTYPRCGINQKRRRLRRSRADGALLTRQQTALEVVKVGFEQIVANAARDHGLLYGLATAMMALLTGWLASVVFRKD